MWVIKFGVIFREKLQDLNDFGLAVMEPVVTSWADGVEPLGGGPAEASTPAPAIYQRGDVFLMEDRCKKEIIELHQFFQEWLTGALPATPEAFRRAGEVVGAGFVIIGPDGKLTERETLLARIEQGHGGRPGLRMWIDQFRFWRQEGQIALATYQEWQETAEGRTVRLSTAIFREKAGTPNGLEWLHVHETWVA